MKYDIDFPKLPPEKDRRRKLMPSDVEAIKALRSRGVFYETIAKEYGVSRYAIYRLFFTPEQAERQRANILRWLKEKRKDPAFCKVEIERILAINRRRWHDPKEKAYREYHRVIGTIGARLRREKKKNKK